VDPLIELGEAAAVRHRFYALGCIEGKVVSAAGTYVSGSGEIAGINPAVAFGTVAVLLIILAVILGQL
jgi:hypothetical protein